MLLTIINGPNLNLLGKREPSVYGSASFESYLEKLQQQFPAVQFEYFQSNIEGELIDAIQKYGVSTAGIIINPGGYTHTSVALGDAIAAITTPVIEVHISNTAARETFRHISHVSAKCAGTIIGLGLTGYALAVQWFVEQNSSSVN
ncbi:MAG: type II 3-dehydroquinate dehydratase [Bacteroidota bacterium]